MRRFKKVTRTVSPPTLPTDEPGAGNGSLSNIENGNGGSAPALELPIGIGVLAGGLQMASNAMATSNKPFFSMTNIAKGGILAGSYIGTDAASQLAEMTPTYNPLINSAIYMAASAALAGTAGLTNGKQMLFDYITSLGSQMSAEMLIRRFSPA